MVWTLKHMLMDVQGDEGLRPHPEVQAQTVKRQVRIQTLTRKNGVLSPWQVQTSMREWQDISIFRHERSSLNYPCIDTVNELITNHFYLFLIMLQGN